MKSRYFKIYRAFSISFNPSHVGNFFWSEILKDFIKVQEKKRLSLVFLSSTKRPHESRSAGTPYLIFASTRIRCDASGSDSTIHTDTLLRFTFANYWPVQLSVSMLKWNPRLWFRGICKCCCGYIEHTWAQWAGLPICLYHAPVRALDETKVVFEDPEEESFYALSSRTKRVHNLDMIKSCFEMANFCRQNSCRGALSAWRILLKSKWVGNTFIVARKCKLLSNCRAE